MFRNFELNLYEYFMRKLNGIWFDYLYKIRNDLGKMGFFLISWIFYL